jgi:5-methylcytosine-specific restriction enzyme A
MAATAGHGNPKWSREETVLALELYLLSEPIVPGPSDGRVVSLSAELRELPIHATQKRQASFRNPAGVAFKLQNLKSVAEGGGLQHSSEMDRMVWAEFGSSLIDVQREAERIRSRFLAKRYCFG